jgi:hypothetical protein
MTEADVMVIGPEGRERCQVSLAAALGVMRPRLVESARSRGLLS